MKYLWSEEETLSDDSSDSIRPNMHSFIFFSTIVIVVQVMRDEEKS